MWSRCVTAQIRHILTDLGGGTDCFRLTGHSVYINWHKAVGAGELLGTWPWAETFWRNKHPDRSENNVKLNTNTDTQNLSACCLLSCSLCVIFWLLVLNKPTVRFASPYVGTQIAIRFVTGESYSTHNCTLRKIVRGCFCLWNICLSIRPLLGSCHITAVLYKSSAWYIWSKNWCLYCLFQGPVPGRSELFVKHFETIWWIWIHDLQAFRFCL